MKKYYFLPALLLMTLASFAQPANDDCANAQVLTISENIATVPFDINTAVLSHQVLCFSTQDYADVWYQFTMPYNGNVDINASTGINSFVLYDACGGNEIICINRHQLLPNLTANTVYTLQLFRTKSSATDPNYQSFTIRAFPEVGNDTCETAQNIAVSTSSSTINYEIGGAHINTEVGCEGTSAYISYADIWYDFTMPINGDISINGGIVDNFVIYDTCNGTQIGCSQSQGSFTDLKSGTTYKLRLFRTHPNAYYGYGSNSFNIIIDSPLGISDEAKNVIRIYPNPAENFIDIGSGNLVNNVSIYNLMGQKVLNAQETTRINISTLHSGTYFVKIKTNDGELIKKIIKK